MIGNYTAPPDNLKAMGSITRQWKYAHKYISHLNDFFLVLNSHPNSRIPTFGG